MVFKTFVNSARTFMSDQPMTYAASLAFYTLISLPGIIQIAMSVLTTAYQEERVKEDLLSRLSSYLGPNTADQAETILNSVEVTGTSMLPQIIGWVVLVFSATTVLISLQDGINKIWHVRISEKSGILRVLFSRLISLGMIVSLGFILMVSLVLDSGMAVFHEWIEQHFGQFSLILSASLRLLVDLFVNTLMFTLIFKILPDVKTEWKYIWPGGLLTSILFMIGKVAIGFYIASSDVGSAFGASGSLIVFLSWAYYSSILVLFGAKFTYEYTKQFGAKLESEPTAEFIKEKAISDVAMSSDMTS